MRRVFVLTQIVRIDGDDCEECPMYWSFGVKKCGATGARLESYYDKDGKMFRPNWCPLCEVIPEKEEEE